MKLKYMLLLVLGLVACQPTVSYNAQDQLTPQQYDKVMSKIIRYVGRKPEKATDSTKFSAQFDEHYQEQIGLHKLELYFENRTGDSFFLVSRRAPSLFEKYVATGGRFKFDKVDSLIEYEEIFRTWKMMPDTLKVRSYKLFDKMVKGESLDKYLTVNSGGIEYIEFPDANVYYDKQERKWKSKQFGTIEDIVESNNTN
ncbi:MAG: hypothetical protein KF763_18415 [Cyclobacteriaceae bacterium]|nr:hypothetical protein [Cyclobacteriaceae bacterium]